MYIIVGLGNPDRKYAFTRHNTGFHVISYLCDKHGISVDKSKFKSMIGEGRIAGQKVVLACPQTYMNLSGQAVVELMNWYKTPPENVIIIYDDADLDIGSIRVRQNGSAGTHNGMKNIVYLTGSDAFPRVRVGIGKCPPGWDMADYVLSSVPDEQKETMRTALLQAADAVSLIVGGELEKAQREYNHKKAPAEDRTAHERPAP